MYKSTSPPTAADTNTMPIVQTNTTATTTASLRNPSGNTGGSAAKPQTYASVLRQARRG